MADERSGALDDRLVERQTGRRDEHEPLHELRPFGRGQDGERPTHGMTRERHGRGSLNCLFEPPSVGSELTACRSEGRELENAPAVRRSATVEASCGAPAWNEQATYSAHEARLSADWRFNAALVAVCSTICHNDDMPRTIPQRELRNANAKVIAAVAAGESFVVTRNGVPVAELRPIERTRRSLVPKAELIALAAAGPHVDLAGFRADLDSAFDQDLM